MKQNVIIGCTAPHFYTSWRLPQPGDIKKWLEVNSSTAIDLKLGVKIAKINPQHAF